jgi:hypothetical protein
MVPHRSRQRKNLPHPRRWVEGVIHTTVLETFRAEGDSIHILDSAKTPHHVDSLRAQPTGPFPTPTLVVTFWAWNLSVPATGTHGNHTSDTTLFKAKCIADQSVRVTTPLLGAQFDSRHLLNEDTEDALHSLHRLPPNTITLTSVPLMPQPRRRVKGSSTPQCSKFSNMLHSPNKSSVLKPMVLFANGASSCPPRAREQRDSRNPFTLDAEDDSHSFHGCSSPSELSQPHGGHAPAQDSTSTSGCPNTVRHAQEA